MSQANHGGGKFAVKTGVNRKADKAFDVRAVDYAKMVAQDKIGNGWRDASGYTKPGSRQTAR